MKNIQINELGTKMLLVTMNMFTITSNYFFDYTTLIELEIFAEKLSILYYDNLKYLSNLKKLLINAPILAIVHKQAFLSLTKLREFRFEAESLRNFNQEFIFMFDLEKVSLFLPKVTFLDNDLFKTTAQLKSIEIISSISFTKIERFHINVPCQNLKFTITKNYKLTNYVIGINENLLKLSLENIEINNSWIYRDLNNLSYLSLRRASLVNLNFLKTLLNLNYLDISYNKVILEENSLLYNQKLKHLNISYNDIGVIQQNFFSGPKSLLTLKMNQCQIHKFESSFSGIFLNKAYYLTFAMNYIPKIPKLLFSKSNHLSILNLNDCMIEDIQRKAFYFLHALKTLDLSENQLKNFYKKTFSKLKSLSSLNISQNCLNEFNINELFQPNFANNLKFLKLNYNNIIKIPDNNLGIFTELTDLNLNYNQINQISANVFSNLKILKVLNLSFNNIKNISGKAFKDLYCLEVLNLSYNSLRFLKKGIFDTLYYLKYLNLSNNCIQCISYKIVHNNYQLENINLEFNNITILPRNIFYSNSQLRFLNFAHNPLMHSIIIDMFRTCNHFHSFIIDENMIVKIDSLLQNRINIYTF